MSEFGSKPGSGGAMSGQNEQIERRERLRKLALETVDLAKDPYFMKNHLGTFECKLCLTLHNNEGNYLAHTQGKRHTQNLAQNLVAIGPARAGNCRCWRECMCGRAVLYSWCIATVPSCAQP